MAGISISILADARNAVRGFRATATEAQTMGQKVKGAAGAMAGPALGVLGGIGAAAFKAAQDASELGDAFDANRIIFGDATKDIQAFAAGASKSLGLSEQAVVDASNAIGTFGAAAGLKDSRLATFTTDLVGRAGDVASMFGGTAAEATEAFGGALRGEFEGVRKYGVLLDEASIKASALSMGLVKATGNTDQIKAANVAAALAQQAVNQATAKYGAQSLQAQKAQVGLTAAQTKLKAATAGVVPELTAQQKTLAIQGALLASTSKANGNFASTASSAKNQQEKLKAELSNVTATMGADLLPALSGAVGALSGMTGWVGKNAGAAKVLIGVVGGLAAAVLVVNGAMRVAAAGQALWTVAATAWGWVTKENIITTTAQAVASKVAAAAQAAWGVVVKIGAGIQAAFNFVMAMNPIGLVVVAIIALIAVFVIAYKKSETFRKIVDASFRAIKTAALFVFEFLKKYIGTVIGIYVAIFRTGLKWIVGAWNWIWNIVTTVINFRNKVIGIILGMVQRFLAVGRSIMRGLADGIAAGIAWVKDKVAGLGNLIPGWLKDVLGIGSPSKVMADIGRSTVQGLRDGMAAQIPAVGRVASKVAAAAVKPFTGAKPVTVDTRFTAVGAPVAEEFTAAGARGRAAAGANIVLNIAVAPLTDPVEVGRQVAKALNDFARSRGLAPIIAAAGS